jgi:hypothetical protein
MKKLKIMLVAALLCTSITSFAQARKKVAVVTFYADKAVNLDDVGMASASVIANLANDPVFDLKPILQKYHEKFFTDYATKFPFDLVPETEVTGNTAYQAYKPALTHNTVPQQFTVIDGYKAIQDYAGHDNEDALLKIFPDYDGIMFVYVTFGLKQGFGVGGTSTTKMQAFTRIIAFNKKGDKVFVINEHANSKKTGVMVGGIPVMTPEKVLPMCESALTELMEDLDKRIDKIIKKTAKNM